VKEAICKAFCNEVAIKEVPAGLAIGTQFRRSDGDAIAFYVVRDSTAHGIGRIEDDGTTIPYLEACGVDFDTETRKRAFNAMLTEYGAEYDEEESLIHTPYMNESEGTLSRQMHRLARPLVGSDQL
jgi:hypothetical protein